MDSFQERKNALAKIIIGLENEALLAKLEELLHPRGYVPPDMPAGSVGERLENYRSGPRSEATTTTSRKSWVDELYGSARFTDAELAADERLHDIVAGARVKGTFKAKGKGRK